PTVMAPAAAGGASTNTAVARIMSSPTVPHVGGRPIDLHVSPPAHHEESPNAQSVAAPHLVTNRFFVQMLTTVASGLYWVVALMSQPTFSTAVLFWIWLAEDGLYPSTAMPSAGLPDTKLEVRLLPAA